MNTKSLNDQDICIVTLAPYERVLCIFRNGVFQNIEETHTNEVYGSSVIWFDKVQTAPNLIAILSDTKRMKCKHCGSEKGHWESIYDWHCDDCGKVTVD